MPFFTDLLTSKIPPQNLEAERAILGAILWQQPGALDIALKSLRPEDFYKEGHRMLWEAIESLSAQGRGIDLVTLSAELRAADHLEEIGGPAALAAIVDEMVDAVFIQDYVHVVRTASAQRRMIQVAAEAIGEAYEASTAPVEALQRAATALQAAADRAAEALDRPDAKQRPQRLAEVLDDVVASLERQETDLAPTPVPELNTRLGGGMLRGELCYLGGRPGTSKTALALQWGLLDADKGFPTLIISREMKNLALGQRVIAQQAMVSATGLRKRELYEHERLRLERVLPRLRGLPIWFDDEASTIAHIRRAVSRLRPRVLIVDYVQLVRAPEAAKRGDRRLEVTAVSAALKDLTMRYGLSVVALSSLRRLQPEKGLRGQPKRRPRPTLDDLKESGDLEADADMVILLHHPDPSSTDRELLFEKLRNGQGGGSVILAWHPAYVRFTEIEGADGPAASAASDPDNPLSEVPF